MKPTPLITLLSFTLAFATAHAQSPTPGGTGQPGGASKPAGGKAKAKGRPTAVGEAIGENTATPVSRIKAAKGFAVELLYSVPGAEQGSWVNLCTDDKAAFTRAINTAGCIASRRRRRGSRSTRRRSRRCRPTSAR